MSEEKTVIAAFRRPHAEAPTSAPQPATKPKRGSAVPVIIFGLVAILLLAAGAGLVVMQIRTGGGPIVVTDADLQNDLVMVDQALPPEETAPEPPEANIIELSGNPVVIRRNAEAPIQRMLLKVEGPAASAGKDVGVKGEIYRLTDALTVADTGLTAGLADSQQSFAFFQSTEEDDTATDTPDSADAGQDPIASADPAGVSAGDSGNDQNTSVLTVDDDAPTRPWVVRELLYRVPAQKAPAAALMEWGVDEQSAKQAEASLAEIFHIRTLNKGDEVALRGFPDNGNDGPLTLVQLSIHREGLAPSILALTDQSTYAAGENPWYGQDLFEESIISLVPPKVTRLLDAVYGAAVRNNVPTPVIGETILLLSRSNNLEQPVVDGQRITLLYNTAARDKKTGFGRVLFVRIDRAQTSIECFAYQSKPGAQFDCISGDGQGTISKGGMVTPVKGVISAKFGPRNNGVDWAAPAGTPVLAAFTGQVVSIKHTNLLGNVVEIKHSDNRKSSYAHLQDTASGIAEGVQVRAGQVIGYVGKSGQTSEPTLHFELYDGSYAIDPFGDYQRVVEKGGAVDQMVNQIIRVESGGNPRAKNPLSTAAGLGQFIKSTWIATIRAHRPSLLDGRSIEEVLELRYDAVIARDMLTELTRDNERYIRGRGVASTPGNLYLAHFLGPDGAVTAARASPDASLIDLFGAGVINANGFLRGKTAGYVVEWAARKMSGKYRPLDISAGSSKPEQKYVADAAFLKLKQAIAVMMQ